MHMSYVTPVLQLRTCDGPTRCGANDLDDRDDCVHVCRAFASAAATAFAASTVATPKATMTT